MAALVVGALAIAPVSASAAGATISKSQPMVGTMLPSVKGTHTVYVQPLTFSQSFSSAHYKTVTAQVAKFWAHEVPGLAIKFVLKKARKTSKATACGRDVAWKYASKISGIAPKRLNEHLMAWGIGCGTFGLAEVGGSYGFSGSEPNFNDPNFYDMSSSVMAHELGHNFGFDHATGLKCVNSAGKRVTLSGKCTEIAYDDANDIMGSGTITDGSARLSGFYRMRVKPTSTLKKVPASGGKVVVAASSTNGYLGALVQTSYGPILFDFEAGRYEYTGEKTLGVSAHVQMTNKNQSQLSFPGNSGSVERGATLLTVGKAWNIPGSTLRVVVTALTSKGATLSFGRNTAPPTIVAPTLAPTDCVVNGPCTITWFGGSSSSGIASYRVETNGVLGPVLKATTEVTEIQADPSNPTTAVVRVLMTTKDGYTSWSAPVTYTLDMEPALNVYSNGALIGSFGLGDTVTVKYKKGQVISWTFTNVGDSAQRAWQVTGIPNVRTGALWESADVAVGDASWTVPDTMFYGLNGKRVYHAPSVLITGGSVFFILTLNGN